MVTAATPTEILIAVFAKSPADVELILREVAAAVEAERAAIRAAVEEAYPDGYIRSGVHEILDARSQP